MIHEPDKIQVTGIIVMIICLTRFNFGIAMSHIANHTGLQITLQCTITVHALLWFVYNIITLMRQDMIAKGTYYDTSVYIYYSIIGGLVELVTN